MAATKRMKRALVSVFHKDGLDEILKKLHSEGVSFVSTGGTPVSYTHLRAHET